MEMAQDELGKAAAAAARIVALDDFGYPTQLKQIYDPPLILYVRGNETVISQPGIALVGTRHPTPYGSGMVERLACDLAARGLVIFSGMARGIDTAGHCGKRQNRGRVGHGRRCHIPMENAPLVEQILALGGAVISEFPIGTFSAPQNFPIRIRILSGFSLGVLVVEAAEFSGTRITARCALEQYREVFAVPGNVTNKGSWMPNTLIKQGAKVVTTWEDVWEELPTDVRLTLQPEGGNESQVGQTASLSWEAELLPHGKKIFALLKADESTHIDENCGKAGAGAVVLRDIRHSV
jgi:DNA processing protein